MSVEKSIQSVMIDIMTDLLDYTGGELSVAKAREFFSRDEYRDLDDSTKDRIFVMAFSIVRERQDWK